MHHPDVARAERQMASSLPRHVHPGTDLTHQASTIYSYHMSNDMVKTTVYLDEADVKSLRAMSKRRARPQAELIREAVHDLLERAHATEPPRTP